MFNALSGGGAVTASYAFATKDANLGRAKVPDDRLLRLAELSKSRNIVHAVCEFVDIGGLVAGAHKGEGLGNRLLAAIREVDAIVFVLRAFESGPGGIDVEGSTDPIEQLETLEFELALADFETAESQLVKRAKAARSDKSLSSGIESLERARAVLSDGTPLYRASLTADDRAELRQFFFLTNKPVLAVVNVGEDGLADLEGAVKPVRDLMGSHAEVLGISVQLEAETSVMAEEARREMLEALGLGEGALPRVVRAAHHLLGRRTFLTTGDKESRAWTFRAGAKAPECAGVIHSDLQRGFIRAECIHWDTLLECGSWAKAKDLGKIRLEGKDYEVLDGDVLEIRFNV